jgi:hypothetical protein
MMDEAKRLALIVEAVRYCQRVRAMGMPASSYTKALREPVHFLWERRGGRSKERCARFRSKASVGVRFGSGGLIYDHAVPFSYLQKELLDLPEVTRDSVRDVLEKHCVVVLVTKQENDRLNEAGLGRKMPEGSDGTDTLARYVAVGIDVVSNSD